MAVARAALTSRRAPKRWRRRYLRLTPRVTLWSWTSRKRRLELHKIQEFRLAVREARCQPLLISQRSCERDGKLWLTTLRRRSRKERAFASPRSVLRPQDPS